MDDNDYLIKLTDDEFTELMNAVRNVANISAPLYSFAGNWTRGLQYPESLPFTEHNRKIIKKIEALKIKGLKCVNVGRSSSTFMLEDKDDSIAPTYATFYTIFDVKLVILSPWAWFPKSRRDHYVANSTGDILAMADTEDDIVKKAAAYLNLFKTLSQ
jgi:hypothetical protein